ncbi:MAG TPA: hypothetical protein VN516_04485 [Candidatus Baltobacteraceae bacterium]|nr:hypothetical protein [Candidatus Baltobacteraceae bacterium]
MADSTPPSKAQLNPTDIFSALSNDIRWQAMKLMADGTKIRATDLAAAVKRDFDNCSKHLTILRESGAVDWVYGEDRRMLFYFIPEKFRTEPGVVDYGFCQLRFASAVKEKINPLAKD